MILAIDPGPTHSAFLLWDGAVRHKGVLDNISFRNALVTPWETFGLVVDHFAIEMIACYGMPVGKEVFETCIQIGRIVEIFDWTIKSRPNGSKLTMVYRRDIKLHLCGSARAKDANIRQALIDRVGPQGKKASPGPTYGLARHDWAALAIAIYVSDLTT